MRPILLFISAFFLTQCANTEDPTTEDQTTDCSIPIFNLAAHTDDGQSAISFQSSSADHNIYDLEYGAIGFTQGSGATVNMVNAGVLIDVPVGQYHVYLRGLCGLDTGSEIWSDWNGPQTIEVTANVSANCNAPDGLNHQLGYDNDNNLTWQHNPVTNGELNPADYFELEYGPSGFSQGSGTSVIQNDNFYVDGNFTAGEVYDFYVRANCGGSSWSDWTGPSSFVGN